MQAIILLSLIVLGANAFWERPEYSDEWSPEPQNPSSPWEEQKPANYPSTAFPNIFSRDHSHQKNAIDTYLVEAEWVCKNQNTGDILILAPQTKDQQKKPTDKPTDTFQQKLGENIPSKQSTPHSNTQKPADKFSPPNMGSHGGEGIINTRLGET